MTQYELGITDPAKRRQLLEELELPQRNATLLAALLWQFYHLPNCFLSQETLAKRFKIKSKKHPRKSIQRAVETLSKLNIVAVQKLYEPSIDKSVNHYSIVWYELEKLVQKQQDERTNRSTVGTANCPDGQPDCNGTFESQQRDISQGPLGHLEATIVTASCPPRREEVFKEQQTEQPVVVDVLDFDSSEDRPQSQVDSRFRFFQLSLQDQWDEVTERLRSYRDSDGSSIGAFQKAIKAAKEEHGWAPSECMRLLNLAGSENRPSSHVANWFIKGTPPSRATIQNGSTLRLKPFPMVGSSLCDNKLNRLWKKAIKENWTESKFQSYAEFIVRDWRELCKLENHHSQDDLPRLNYLRSLFPDARALLADDEPMAQQEVSQCH